MSRQLALLCLCTAISTGVATTVPDPSGSVNPTEAVYADLNDANSIIGAIDAGSITSYRSLDRAAWEQVLRERREQLAVLVARLSGQELPSADSAVIAVLKSKLASLTDTSSADSSASKCRDASHTDLDYPALRAALVSCFVEKGNNLVFEDGKIDRASALGLLSQIEESERRKSLFFAFAPLWEAVNGHDDADSPYRRLIAMAASDAASHGSEIDAAARTLGVSGADIEGWLQQTLDVWREVHDGQAVEPWDYRYEIGEADRLLAARIPRESLRALNERYYHDLGADLTRLGVIYDLEPRTGKSSVAYTDFVIHGRTAGGRWQPTIARVLATYSRGGLSSLNELVHENGHAVHISAIRNRPAYVDWPDDLFTEAFADVPSWSTYEPAWQRRYLGGEAPERAALRALYGNVMLDLAWALFEIRMLRTPTSDPNALWTDITSRYLHIVPHPEVSWWAVRVQLVDAPGYMVNYGLGAVLTADLREHLRKTLGPIDTGNPRWYPWLSEHLLRFGSERSTAALLRGVLGRPVSPQALLTQLRRLSAAHAAQESQHQSR
jgi:hypothetical protein